MKNLLLIVCFGFVGAYGMDYTETVTQLELPNALSLITKNFIIKNSSNIMNKNDKKITITFPHSSVYKTNRVVSFNKADEDYQDLNNAMQGIKNGSKKKLYEDVEFSSVTYNVSPLSLVSINTIISKVLNLK